MFYDKLISLVIPEGVYNELESLSEEKGVTMEYIINEAIICLLRKKKEEEK